MFSTYQNLMILFHFDVRYWWFNNWRNNGKSWQKGRSLNLNVDLLLLIRAQTQYSKKPSAVFIILEVIEI